MRRPLDEAACGWLSAVADPPLSTNVVRSLGTDEPGSDDTNHLELPS
jgi:hypothetical protein